MAAVVVALACSCASPVGVKRLSPAAAERSLYASVLTGDVPSETSRQFLYRLHLAERFENQPAAVLAELHAGLGGRDEPSRLFTLSELSYAHARRSGDRAFSLASAVYAWAFLFPAEPALRPDAYDLRHRLALDLYNRALASGLATGDSGAKALDLDLAARTVRLPFADLQIHTDPADLANNERSLSRFVPISDFEVRGLRNRYRRHGLGVVVVADAVSTGQQNVDRWLSSMPKVPLTAVLLLGDPREALRGGGPLRADVELYDVVEQPVVRIGDQDVPLENENSTVLAYRLDGSPLWDFEIAGFRRGDFRIAQSSSSDSAMYMLHSYHAGRIPVVFVHGTASSPARWAEMTNEIINDPVLGQRYQPWFFLYNTGNPVAYSAMLLRESLRDIVHDLDPESRDPALRQMVVIGHSQGGLLAKMMVIRSGTTFWDNVSDVPFEQTRIDDDARDLMRRGMFFEPSPTVRRVVFIATPLRGSYQADNFFGDLARRLVSLPAKLTRVGFNIVTLQASGAIKAIAAIPTSIDNMKSSSPFIRSLSSLPIDESVRAHTIIPVRGNGPPELGDDGVVRYTSAHMDCVDSEFVVRSSHSTQSTPETIEEVRRILYVHLDGTSSDSGTRTATSTSTPTSTSTSAGLPLASASAQVPNARRQAN